MEPVETVDTVETLETLDPVDLTKYHSLTDQKVFSVTDRQHGYKRC